jgi:hypothetical protein
MTTGSAMKPRASSALILLSMCGMGCPAQDSLADRSHAMLYDVTTETGMPHLDEALRYATTRGRRCMDTQDLSRAFPILQDVSLQDCRLALRSQRADSATYALQCSNGHGTSGEARWRFDDVRIAGTLDVKLGGKNMTFHQRVTGRVIGTCS